MHGVSTLKKKEIYSQGSTSVAERRREECLSLLPTPVAREIRALVPRGMSDELSEIRLGEGISTLTLSKRRVPLVYRMSREEIDGTLTRMCGGAVYAHRDTVSKGYITLEGGTRVGILGSARYDGGRMAGTVSPRSLIIRIPSGRCDFSEELSELWYSRRPRGLLIISPPGWGKTTALRALARSLGAGPRSLRVIAVDERCEFDPEDYNDCTVELLRGYRRCDGIEAAVRYGAPDVVMVDEIGGAEDAGAMELCLGVGVSVVATAHGASVADALRRSYISELVRMGSFDTAVCIRREGEGFRLGEAEELL